eukprot:227861_1
MQMIKMNKINDEKTRKSNKEENADEKEIIHNIINPVPMESERRLQLKAMLDIEAVDGSEDEGNDCWCIEAVDGMADVPHVHQCEVQGIHECLLEDQDHYYSLPNREEIKRSNAQWKKQFEFEIHNLVESNRDTSSDEPIIQPIIQANNGKNIIHTNHNPMNAKRNMDLNMNGAHPAYYNGPVIARNYDPKQYPSPSPRYGLYHPNNAYHHSSNPQSPHRRRNAAAGKGRKGRNHSGKGVSGKSLSRNTTIGAKRRGITPNTMRNTRYSSPNTGTTHAHGSMHWSATQPSTAHTTAYRQRMQSQRIYHIPSSSPHQQRLQRYNANYQRLRNNNNSNTNTSNNSNSPFPSHYNHTQYNSSQRR